MKSLTGQLFSVTPVNFEAHCVALFKQQAGKNPVYSQYVNLLGINPQHVKHVHQIPFMPISFFRDHTIKTGQWHEVLHFESSGTTGSRVSRHYIKDASAYLAASTRTFEQFYGPLQQYQVLALLPAYLERQHASLVFMARHFIQQCGQPGADFYLYNYDVLDGAIEQCPAGIKTLLLGVSFALLNYAEHRNGKALPPSTIVMETGGMKGRRREMIREELHQNLGQGFGLSTIHSEYGMTELLSQAYALKNGRFNTPPWLRILVRDINDPFTYLPVGKSGGVNIIDLANTHSCAFIETQDLGRLHPDGSFEILGRYDHADVRGCNLLVV